MKRRISDVTFLTKNFMMFTSEDVRPFHFTLKVLQIFKIYPKKSDLNNMRIFIIKFGVIEITAFFFICVSTTLHSYKTFVGKLIYFNF